MPGGGELFLPREKEPNGTSGLLGKESRKGLVRPDLRLPAESAADENLVDVDVAERDVQGVGQFTAKQVARLGGRPEFVPTLGVALGHAPVGFHGSLRDRLGRETAFDHQRRPWRASSQSPALRTTWAAMFLSLFSCKRGASGWTASSGIEDGWQRLVFDFDERKRLRRRIFIHGRDGCDLISDKPNRSMASGYFVLVGMAKEMILDLWGVLGRDHGLDAPKPFGLGGIDVPNPGVRVRTPQDLPCSIRGRVISKAYVASPVRRSSPSTLAVRWPTMAKSRFSALNRGPSEEFTDTEEGLRVESASVPGVLFPSTIQVFTHR